MKCRTLAKHFAHFWKFQGRLGRLTQHKWNVCVCVQRGRGIREKSKKRKISKIADVRLHKHMKIYK